MRVTLIHNPGAGRSGGAGELTQLLEEAGHEVRARSMKDGGWKEALDWPADVVAVAGGDGSVARVAKAALGKNLPVAPLPSGTANNISRTLGLVERPFEELVRAWPDGRRWKLDIGLARGPWGERYFVEGVGTGLFACLLSKPKSAKKEVTAMPPAERVAGALQLLKDEAASCLPVEMKMTLDGKDLSGSYLLAEAVNIAHVGPNLFLAPDSQPGDGGFDVVLVTEAERDRLKNYLDTWQENRERIAVLPSHRGAHLRVEWTGFDLHIDDDLWPENGAAPRPPAAIELSIAGQVEFLAPDPRKKRR